jgi:hypothetical protein
VSTKDLSRTVIEGGRRFYNAWERRHSHRKARRAQHAHARALAACRELDDAPFPEPRTVPRQFHDRLSAAERWLESKIGRGWDRVRSEMFQRFDTRTLAGRHIVHDHLLRSRPLFGEPADVWRVDRVRFRVDVHGILRRGPPPVYPPRPIGPRADVVAALQRFVACRRLIARGAHVFWLVPIESHEGVRYRQHRALDERELATWRAFEPALQRLVLLIDPNDVP